MNRKFYKELERFTHNMCICIADIVPIWNDIRIAYMNKLYEIRVIVKGEQ